MQPNTGVMSRAGKLTVEIYTPEIPVSPMSLFVDARKFLQGHFMPSACNLNSGLNMDNQSATELRGYDCGCFRRLRTELVVPFKRTGSLMTGARPLRFAAESSVKSYFHYEIYI